MQISLAEEAEFCAFWILLKLLYQNIAKTLVRELTRPVRRYAAASP